jgi:hypothetical protein
MLHIDQHSHRARDARPEGVAELRLVCLVRSGDGYVVRGAGRLIAAGDTRAHLDISFGDAGDRRAAAALDVAVRHIQRWCELGTPVALLATSDGVTLRGDDGTAVPLPRCAA